MLTRFPLILASLVFGAPAASATPLIVEFKSALGLGSSATDQKAVSFTVTGLSGITWLGGTRYAAVMDNSNKVVFLLITLGADGTILSATVQPGVGGGLAVADTRDFEDIAFTGEARNTAWISEEGSPEIREYDLATGAFLRALPRPAIFANRRPNFGFESLSLNRTHSRLWTCNEEALSVDGPQSTQSDGTLIRLLSYDYTSPAPVPLVQFVYLTERIHGSVISGARSGVSQLLALPNGRLLALERSFAFAATFFQTRIYEVDFSGATDVSSLPSLVGPSYVRASKSQLYKGDQTNLEGLCLGPKLAGGGYALIGIVDDADPISVNRVVSFRLTGPVDSACPADLNDDGAVDDSDFVRFAASYNLLLDPVGDLNLDGATDDTDFVLFAAAYDELTCH